MTFWQENHGFVKDVYDYRIQKYNEWMDSIEAIVVKVMSQDVQYTYKEFKVIKDNLNSLCRDLEKDGLKQWLDMMLEKVAVKVTDESGGQSQRDKDFKKAEKKKLEALVERHKGLMPSTEDTIAKVDVYSRCYAYGDDISPVLKTLEEIRHLSVKEIHPHNMKMVEEQIEKADKNMDVVESQRSIFEELLTRGRKLSKNPNCPPFMEGLLEKFDMTMKEATEKSHLRHKTLSTAATDWEKYDETRAAVLDPIERVETELKRYHRYFDPNTGSKRLGAKKETLERLTKDVNEMYDVIKRCYTTILVIAGEEKKEFLDKEVRDVEERKAVLDKAHTKLTTLSEYNDKLTKATSHTAELRGWAEPSQEKLQHLTTSKDMSPEDRVKEILGLQEEANERLPQLDPLEASYKELFSEEDLDKSETAKNVKEEFLSVKTLVTETCATIETEAASISQDQRFYADYLCGVKDFKPWMDDAESSIKEELPKPQSIEDALALLDSVKSFDSTCAENKSKLDSAADARDKMEKQSSTMNETEPLFGRWGDVKKIAEERVQKVNTLVETWQQLSETTTTLSTSLSSVPAESEPNIENLEKVFTEFKTIFAKKKELLQAV